MKLQRINDMIQKFKSTFQPSPVGNSEQWVRRVEPPFWWAEMNQPEMQIMLYGDDLRYAEIFIDHPGVTISRKELSENRNCIFLYLEIMREVKPGEFNIVLTKGEKEQTIKYELKKRRKDSASRISFSEADAIYLIMPDRFVNGNPKNDFINGYQQGVNRKDPGSRHGGDIAGIISKIPYLAELGITALWTTPLFENNETQYSYHHYACSDYYRVDPRLGENEDYIRLSDACHAYGLKLIIDVVPNHCGSSHWWMKDLPAKDWLNTWPTYTSTNYKITAWTDPHASSADLNRLTHGWFAPSMPDLNLQNPLLFDYLRQVYVYWIEYANIDGIRVDTYPYNDIKTAARLIQSIRDEYQQMTVVGECWVNTPAEIAYYQSGTNNKDGFDSRMTSVMDFALKNTFKLSFNETEKQDSGMIRFYEHFAQDFVYANTNLIMNFLDNHDICRYSSVVKRDVKKYKMALAILLTIRGYPQIYYGTEIMLEGNCKDSYEDNCYEGHRFDFPGGWAADQRNAFTEKGRTSEENEVYNYLKTLLNYRKNNPVLHNGGMKQFIPEDGIYVYFRFNKEKTLMIIANDNDNAKQLAVERFDEMLNTKTIGVSIVTGDKYLLSSPVSIPAKTVLILEIR